MNTSRSQGKGRVHEILAECAAALQCMANYELPPALDRRLLWLSENKESLTEAEREELEAAIEFAEERSVEKLRVQATLRKLEQLSKRRISMTDEPP